LGSYFERAETSQRGFLITANKEYLETYQNSLTELLTLKNHIQKLVSDNPNQSAISNQLSEILNKRIEKMNSRIVEKQAGKFNFQDLASSGAGNSLTKQLRSRLRQMELNEYELLNQRKELRGAVTEKAGWLAIAGTFVALLLGISSRQIINQEREDNYRQARILDLIIESMSDGVVVVNDTGMFTLANKAAQSFIGPDFKQVLPHERATYFGMHNPETMKLYDSADLPLAKALKGEVTEDFEVVFKNKWVPDGVLTAISGAPLLNPDSSIKGAIAVFRDISKKRAIENEWKSARQSAIEASKLKSDFLATMSHEIRTPMNGIIGMSTLLVDTKLNSEQFEYVGIIKRSAQALLNLINGILDISKIEAGKLTLEPHFFDLNEMLKDTVDIFKFSAIEKKIKLSLNSDLQAGVSVNADGGRLRQVLINLIGNALKFTEAGEVSLNIKTLQKLENKIKLRFEVKDTGIGLTAEEISHLFVHYNQTKQGAKKGGTGLGLSISQQLIGLMQGKIQIESEKHKGSTFWFELEFEHSTAEFCKLPEKTVATGSFSGHILIVEDQKVNQKVIVSLLEKLGLTTEIADNGQIALQLCQSKKFDLIFMDCRMPVMDGYEATKKIRESSQNKLVPIVALSAEGSSGDQKLCYEVGMNDFVGKPIEVPRLLEALKRFLPNSQLAQVDFTALRQYDEFSTPESDLVLLLIDEYKLSYPTSLAELDKAVSSKNVTLLNDTAHGLKSSSAALGMLKVADICLQLEKANEINSQTNSQLAQLRSEIEAALAILQQNRSRKV
jgi:PAS domain S-box-containing protein